MKDHELDELFPMDSVGLAENLLPDREQDDEPFGTFSKRFGTDEQMFTKNGVTLNRPHYIRSFRTWRAQGESIEAFITGCDKSIQDAVRELAKLEGFL